MSRRSARWTRPAAVWALATVVAAVTASSVPGAWSDAASARGADRTAEVVVAGCATALALSLAWLWLLVTTTVVGVLRRSAPTRDGAVRRLVLVACGAAAVAGAAVPSHAAGGEGAERLVGLPLPERAVAPSAAVRPVPRPPSPGDTYVVRPGDSLWSIARAHPATGRSVETRWRSIWAANREVVGDDPDLIHPGQALRLPATHPDTDGERR